jgi:hypothetical protein
VSELVNSDTCPRPTTTHVHVRLAGGEGLPRELYLGFGRIVASEKEVPNMV